jgi:hypothetical protein
LIASVRSHLGWLRREAPVAPREGSGDVGHAQDQVHRTGLDGAARHPAVACLVGVLGNDQATGPLDRAQAQAAVGAGARKDDCGGAGAARLGQRIEQKI